jgi:hypothetical protein
MHDHHHHHHHLAGYEAELVTAKLQNPANIEIMSARVRLFGLCPQNACKNFVV